MRNMGARVWKAICGDDAWKETWRNRRMIGTWSLCIWVMMHPRNCIRRRCDPWPARCFKFNRISIVLLFHIKYRHSLYIFAHWYANVRLDGQRQKTKDSFAMDKSMYECLNGIFGRETAFIFGVDSLQNAASQLRDLENKRAQIRRRNSRSRETLTNASRYAKDKLTTISGVTLLAATPY